MRLLLSAVLIAAFVALSEQAKMARGKLPAGDIPQECCRIFCPPKDICVCCFLDYEYHDGMQTVSTNGVPSWLLAKYGMSRPKREAVTDSKDFADFES